MPALSATCPYCFEPRTWGHTCPEFQSARYQPRFELGRLLATPGAIDVMTRRGINPTWLLARHVSGDWGEVDEHDVRENELSVERGFRILSAYGAEDDPDRLWVITEAADDDGQRAATTILRPDEY